MLIPSVLPFAFADTTSLSRRVNANSQQIGDEGIRPRKLIKKGEC